MIGECAQQMLGSRVVPLEITPGGLFTVGAKKAGTTVSISLPADAPLRDLIDRPSLFASGRISGSAELAECLGFVFRNLRWGAENDLSRLVGDIAARRLVAGGKQLAHWNQQQTKNIALNLAEYFHLVKLLRL